MKGLKYMYVLSEFKHKNCLLLTGVICYALHFKFVVWHSVAGLERAKLFFHRFKRFLFIIVIVI